MVTKINIQSHNRPFLLAFWEVTDIKISIFGIKYQIFYKN